MSSEVWDGLDDLRDPFFEFLQYVGDDSLVLGHRLSEWCGHGPSLEEDIALANIALDLIGRADAVLHLAGTVEGRGRSQDDLAYFRDAIEYRNVALVELPRGDFAFTMVRQFLFDAFAFPFFEALVDSAPGPLAGIAAKAVKETAYHLRHSSEWIRRLGGGTEESHRRAQNAVDDVWMYTNELFEYGDSLEKLTRSGWIPDPSRIRSAWSATVDPLLAEAGLEPPDLDYFFSGSRSGVHTEHLGHLLSELQILARSHPGAEW